ncbi:hypothetical protein LKD47_03890, partial [Roseburia sp. CLA-AA-H204]
KIKPPSALYFQGLKAVFINTFCPITPKSACKHAIFLATRVKKKLPQLRQLFYHLFEVSD